MKKAQLTFLALIAAEVNQIAVCLEGIAMALGFLAIEEEVEDADESEFGDVVWTFRIKYHTALGEECCFLRSYCGAELEEGDKKMKPEEVETVTRDAIRLLREAQCMNLCGRHLESLKKMREAEMCISSIWGND